MVQVKIQVFSKIEKNQLLCELIKVCLFMLIIHQVRSFHKSMPKSELFWTGKISGYHQTIPLKLELIALWKQKLYKKRQQLFESEFGYVRLLALGGSIKL